MSKPVQLYCWHFMSYPYLPADFDQKYHTGWVTVPNRLWDSEKSRGLYREYIEQLAYADDLGFDGMVLHEHHQNVYGLIGGVGRARSHGATHPWRGLCRRIAGRCRVDARRRSRPCDRARAARRDGTSNPCSLGETGSAALRLTSALDRAPRRLGAATRRRRGRVAAACEYWDPAWSRRTGRFGRDRSCVW
jgi:hypothetical protein